MSATHDIVRVGFLPLLDSALLIVAKEKGFAGQQGIDLELVRETSWANIRDRLAVGHFDVAHMLAPMPIASQLKLNPLDVPVIAPMSLGLGGNAITVSNQLWSEMDEQFGAEALPPLDPNAAGKALKLVIDSRRDGRKLRIGVVHPFSAHNLELRYWLAASGIDPRTEVEIVVTSPPFLPDALESGHIDGFCVGAPWNSVAVAKGLGRIVTVKSRIWKSSPEKVLGVAEHWAEKREELLSRLILALYHAAEYCGQSGAHGEIAAIMSHASYLNQNEDWLMRGLAGNLQLGGGATANVPDFFIPFARAANFPWRSHALWLYAQMVRWGYVEHSTENAALAERSYRPDLYRAALKTEGLPVPGANSKVEGSMKVATPVGASNGALSLGPDGVFTGEIFDPTQLDAFIAAQKM